MSTERFNPTKVERFPAYRGIGETHYTDCVLASDFEALLALYNDERNARKEDALDNQRELRNAAAEIRWAERQGEEYGSF